jgi:hypothetical protein
MPRVTREIVSLRSAALSQEHCAEQLSRAWARQRPVASYKNLMKLGRLSLIRRSALTASANATSRCAPLSVMTLIPFSVNFRSLL